MATPRLDFDESPLPLVVVTLQGELSAADYEEMFSRAERLMREGLRRVMILDLRKMTRVADAKRRQELAQRTNDMEQKYGTVRVGSAIIVESALVRGAMTALNWLRRSAGRDVWVRSMAEALVASDELAEEVGLSIPPIPKQAVLP